MSSDPKTGKGARATKAPAKTRQKKRLLLEAPPRSGSSGIATAAPTMGEIGLNNFVPYLLNRVSARWNANMQGVLETFDMTTTKMRTLAVLSVMPGLTINELAIHAIAEQSTMSRTLDALEEQKLIRRQARTDDMRVREIYITEEGRALFDQIWSPMYEMYSQFFAGVEDSERQSLVNTLHKVIRNIQA